MTNPANPAADTGLPDNNIPPLDWTAARKRILAAGVFLGDERMAEDLAAQNDDDLNERPELIRFARKHEISLDWLVAGEGLPMLDPERTRRHRT